MDSTRAPRVALVVEDDDDIRNLLVQTLSMAGFSVSEAVDGLAAMELARSVDPELVTLDLNLPGQDGFAVCRQLREFSDAYVIMLTARTAEDDKLTGLESGADDFLAKPFSPRELRARVEALFRRPRGPQAGSSELDRAEEVQRGLLPAPLPALAGFDLGGSFRPSRQVGGDFYDWHLEGETLQLTLADAMGKGMGAALIAATVRATFRSCAHIGDPARAFARAASTLSGGLEASGSFATVFAARLDLLTAELKYVDAGHGVVAVTSPEGGVRRLDPGGPPIGLWPGGEWGLSTTILGPGESLVIASDGVLDAFADMDSALAAVADVVVRAADAQSAADAVTALAAPDSGPAIDGDDVTVVVVRRAMGQEG